MKGKIWILAILILVAANAQALSTDYNTNLKAYWGLQGNLLGNNVSGAGNLTLHYSPSNRSGANCVIGECMGFDGSFGNDYMSAVDDYLHGYNVTTISFWTYRTLYGAWDNRFSLGNNKDRIGDGGDSTIVNFVVSGSGSIVNATYQVLNDSANSVWEHWLMTSDGDRFRVYVNGVLRVNESQGGPWDGDGTIYFATRYDTASEWGGHIDEIGIWHQSFTTAMAVEIYNSSNGVPFEVLAASGSGAIAWVEEPTNLSYKSNATLGVQYNATGAETFWDNSHYFKVNSTGYLTEAYELLEGNYTLNVSVNDTSGNIATKEITIEIKKPLKSFSTDLYTDMVFYGGTGNSTILKDNRSTNDGTVNGARPVECPIGNCMDFDKDNIKFDINLKPNYSICLWVNIIADGADGRNAFFYIENVTEDNNKTWCGMQLDKKLSCYSNDASISMYPNTYFGYNQNVHFCFLNNDDVVQMYGDGELLSSDNSHTLTNVNRLGIGYNYDSWFRSNGTFDELGVWNRTLTQTEISLLANKTPYYEMPTQDAVAFYDFQNGTEDVTGNGHDGTNNGAYHVKAVEGMQYKYDGNDDYIISRSITDFPDSDFTICSWARSDKGYDTQRSVYNLFRTDSSSEILKLVQRSDGFGIDAYGDYGNSRYNFFTQVQGQNHHLCIVMNEGNNMTVYVDGQYDSIDDSISTYARIYNITLGGNSNLDGSWNGTIDEVTIWNRSLTASEVKETYLLPGYVPLAASAPGYSAPVINSVNNSIANPTDIQNQSLNYSITSSMSVYNSAIWEKNVSGNWVSDAVLYMPFDRNETGTVTDLSSNNSSGTIINDAKWTNEGFKGGAYKFAAENERINLPDRIIQNTSVSINMWVYQLQNSSLDMALFYYAKTGSPTTRIVIYRNDGVEYRVLRQPSNNNIVYSAPAILNQWFMLSYVYNKSTNHHYLYFNGMLVEDDVGQEFQDVSYDGNRFLSGGVGTNFWNGTIDEFAIYNRALSASEILAIYQNQSILHSDTTTAGEQWRGHLYTTDTISNYVNATSTPFTIQSSSDTTPPTWTQEPQNKTFNLGESIGIQFNATDNAAIDSFYSSTFGIEYFSMNSTGFLTNVTGLAPANFHFTLYVNDTSNNTISKYVKFTIINNCTSSWSNSTVSQAVYQSCNSSSLMVYNTTLLWTDANACNSSYNTYILNETSCNSYTCDWAKTGLISSWSDGNATVFEDNHSTNDGTVVGARYVKCALGGCRDYSKENEYISLPNLYDGNDSEYAVSMWFTPFGEEGVVALYSHGYDYTTYSGWALNLRPDINQYQIYTRTAGLNGYFGTYSLNLTNIIVSRNATTNNVSIYLNGILVRNKFYERPYSSVFRIGRVDSNEMNGTIDEFTLWDRAISSSEALAIYNNRTANNYSEWDTSLKNKVWSHYAFENDVVDTLGNNTATLYGTTPVECASSGCYLYDGIDDLIKVPSNSKFLSNQITVSAWVQTNEYDGDVSYVALDNATRTFNLMSTSSEARWRVFEDDSSEIRALTSNIPNELELHNIVGTANGTHTKLYINGILKDTNPYDGTIKDGLDDLTIGFYGSYNVYHNGTIDEVSIWNRSLNATELKNLYNVRSLPTCTVLGVCTPSLANTSVVTSRIQVCNISNVSVWQNQTIEYDTNSCGGANTTYLINYTKSCTFNASIPSNVSYTGQRLACEQNRSCCYDVAGNVDTLCWVNMDWDDCLTEANTTGFCPEALYEYDSASPTYQEVLKMKNFGSDFHVSNGGSEDFSYGGVFGGAEWRSYTAVPRGLRTSGGSAQDIYCNAWKCMLTTNIDYPEKFYIESEGFVWKEKYVGWTAAKCVDADNCDATAGGNTDGIRLVMVSMPTTAIGVVDSSDYDCDDCLIIEYNKSFQYSKWEGTLEPTFLVAVHPAPTYYTGVGSSATVNMYWDADNGDIVNVTYGMFRKDQSADLNDWIQNVTAYQARETEVKRWTYDFYSAFNKPNGYSDQNKSDYYWGVNTFETSTLGCFNDSDTTSTYYVDGHCADVHIPTMEFYPAMWPWDSSNSAAGLLVAINYSHQNASYVLNRTVADWLRVWTEHSSKYPSESAWFPGLAEHYQETNLQHHAGWPLVALNLYNRTGDAGYPLLSQQYFCNNISGALRSHYEYIQSNKDIDADGLYTLAAVQHGRDGTQAQYSVVENSESTIWQIMAALTLREIYELCGNATMADDMADDYTQMKTNFETFWNSSCNGGSGCYWNFQDNSGTFYNWGAGNQDMATTPFTSILAPALLNGTQARAEYLVKDLAHNNFTDTYAYTSISTAHPCYSPNSDHVAGCDDGETWDGAIWAGVDNFWGYQAMLDMISRRGFDLASEKDWLCANNMALYGLEGSASRTPYGTESYNPVTGSVTDSNLWASNPFGWGANVPTMCVSDTNLFSLLDLGESEPDTTPPSFYGVTNTSTDHDSTFIKWNTTEPANSTVCYGTTTALGTCTGNTAYVEPHSILLSGLTNNTIYYYNLTSCDTSHNCNTSGIFNFTTGTPPAPETYNWSDIYSSIMMWYHDGKGFAHWPIADQMYYDQPAYMHSLLNRYEDTQNLTYLNLSAWIAKNVTGEYSNWGLAADDFRLWHIGGMLMHFARHAKASGVTKYMEVANDTADFVIANISNPGLAYLNNWSIDGVEMAILTEGSGQRAKPLNQNYGCALMNVYLYNVTGNITYNTTATRMANAFMYASGTESCHYDPSKDCFTYSYRYDFEQPWEDYTGYTWGFPPHREEKHYLVQDFEAFYTLWHYGFVGNSTIQKITNAIHDNMVPQEGHFDNVLIAYQVEHPPTSYSDFNEFYATHWVDAIGYYSPWNANVTNITESVLRHVYDFVNDGDGTYTFGGHPYGTLTDPRTGQYSEYVPSDPTDGEKADVLVSHLLKSISTHLYPNKGSALILYSGDVIDRIDPNWTQVPGNISIQDNESLAVQYNATDNIGIDTYIVNDTNFSINSSGYFTNNTALSIQNYTINISVNDTSGNILSKVITIEVTNSSIADTTPPTIANVTNSSITNVSVTIAWDLTEAGNGTLFYGNTSALGITVANASFILAHTFDISGLSPNTTYHYNVTSCDASGNCNTSGGHNFSTIANAVDNNPPIIANRSISATSSSATITWDTNETSNSIIDYGISTSLGTTTSSASLVTDHSLSLYSLTAGTTYYYNITSCDYSDNCARAGPYSFTTESAGGGGGGADDDDLSATQEVNLTVNSTNHTTLNSSITSSGFKFPEINWINILIAIIVIVLIVILFFGWPYFLKIIAIIIASLRGLIVWIISIGEWLFAMIVGIFTTLLGFVPSLTAISLSVIFSPIGWIIIGLLIIAFIIIRIII